MQGFLLGSLEGRREGLLSPSALQHSTEDPNLYISPFPHSFIRTAARRTFPKQCFFACIRTPAAFLQRPHAGRSMFPFIQLLSSFHPAPKLSGQDPRSPPVPFPPLPLNHHSRLSQAGLWLFFTGDSAPKGPGLLIF